ncbi:MAG: hypothetical protein HQL83_15835 [Magnetococcales bacterium]|nr:hypothetical protein [Magnetococcales bacterium]
MALLRSKRFKAQSKLINRRCFTLVGPLQNPTNPHLEKNGAFINNP